MGQKMMKTEKELQTIVLGELHTHAECSNVKQVTITRIYGETWGVKTTNHDHEFDSPPTNDGGGRGASQHRIWLGVGATVANGSLVFERLPFTSGAAHTPTEADARSWSP